jgi:hypothetical protein
VLHAVRKIESLVGNDSVLADEIELLKRLSAGVARSAVTLRGAMRIENRVHRTASEERLYPGSPLRSA